MWMTIDSGENKKFSLAFTGRITWITCTQSFLFSMINPHGLRPTKLSINKSKFSGLFCDSSLGPKFGGNRDPQIISGKEKAHSEFGFSFDVPPGH